MLIKFYFYNLQLEGKPNFKDFNEHNPWKTTVCTIERLINSGSFHTQWSVSGHIVMCICRCPYFMYVKLTLFTAFRNLITDILFFFGVFQYVR